MTRATHAVTVKLTPNERRTPAGKLADAELHFDDGPLAGLKLLGFVIWKRRGRTGRTVTFPSRQYRVDGEDRSFALLRPIYDDAARERIQTLILDAYANYEQRTEATA